MTFTFHPEAEAEGIFIPAGMHLQRDPDDWRHRQ
jgi:hypothetical protein